MRGLLLTRLRQLTGDVAAIALTAVVFAGMHVGRAPGGHGWRPDLADLAAYAVVIPLCLALFRVSPLQTGKP